MHFSGHLRGAVLQHQSVYVPGWLIDNNFQFLLGSVGVHRFFCIFLFFVFPTLCQFLRAEGCGLSSGDHCGNASWTQLLAEQVP